MKRVLQDIQHERRKGRGERNMRNFKAYSIYSLQGAFAACVGGAFVPSLVSVFCPAVAGEGGGCGGTPALPAF